MTSRIPGFYRLPPQERLAVVARLAELGDAEVESFDQGLALGVADAMIENVIGRFVLPAAVAVNVMVNGRDRLLPMVIEEPSVVAAVSNMARVSRAGGGVFADADDAVMIGQVQLAGCAPGAAERLRAAIPHLSEVAAAVHPQLLGLGGGLRGMEVRELAYDEPGFAREEMVVLHFFLDCVDAMGANMVNSVAERLAPEIQALTGGRIGLRILSNLADRRLARARVHIPVSALDGEGVAGDEVAEGVAAAWRFAWADPYRATTHNKGVMNGVDALCLATGNDWRAIEAGAHAYAARDGHYRPLTTWRVDGDSLHGNIELPIQVGTVSGPIRVHPTVQANLRIAGVTGARDLAMLMATVGLIQNLAALRALATEGIQLGHMRMHARTVALAAGAQPEELGAVVAALCASHDFRLERARAELEAVRRA